MSFAACDYADSSYSANATFLNELYIDKNVRGIGRYYDYSTSINENEIGGASNYKVVTKAEVDAIHNAGIKVWTVFENGTSPSYFTYSQGQKDCHEAVYLAGLTGQPAATVIFFAVDGCSQESFESNIVNYFNGVIEYMNTVYGNKYGVGGYIDSTTFNYLKNNLQYPSLLGSYWHHCGTVGTTTPGPAIEQYNGDYGTYEWYYNSSTNTFDSSYKSGDWTIDIDRVDLVVDTNDNNIYW